MSVCLPFENKENGYDCLDDLASVIRKIQGFAFTGSNSEIVNHGDPF